MSDNATARNATDEREALLSEAVAALEEIIAEIEAGNLGRLTVVHGMKAWDESGGTQQARDVLRKLQARK